MQYWNTGCTKQPRGLRIVFGIALNNRATVEEITKALPQVAIYAGDPAAFDALPILQEELAS